MSVGEDSAASHGSVCETTETHRLIHKNVIQDSFLKSILWGRLSEAVRLENVDGGDIWIVPHNKKLTLTCGDESCRFPRHSDTDAWPIHGFIVMAVLGVFDPNPTLLSDRRCDGEMFVFDGADDGSLQRCVRLQNSLLKSRAGTGSQADPPIRQFGVCFLPNFGFTDSLKSHFACCHIKTLLCNQNTKCCFASLLFLLLFLVSVRWSN